MVNAGTVLFNLDDGVDVEENDCGDLDASFTLSGVNLNTESGFDPYQDDCGGDTGDLTLTATSALGNSEGSFNLDGVVLN